MRKGPSAYFNHDHKIICLSEEKQLSRGQAVADKVTSVLGSWRFIIIQSVLLIAWMIANVLLVLAYQNSWDPYPFILLNLVLSFQAAYTGPIVLMSQNRQAEKDRHVAQQDYETNIRAEEELRVIMQHQVHHDELLTELLQRGDSIE